MPKSGCNNDKNERTRIFYPIKDSESFDYKTGSAGNLPALVNEAELEDVKIVVPLKNLSNFMFHLDILLIENKKMLYHLKVVILHYLLLMQ